MKTLKTYYLIALAGLVTASASAQLLVTRHDFSALVNNTNSDGAQSSSSLLLARDGSLCGTASSGGTNGSGTIFKFTPSSGAFQVMHTFSAFSGWTNADGAFPYGELVQDSDGNFYGTAVGGGAYENYGVVFKMTTNGSITLLHSFDLSDSENPAAGLTPAGVGTFYGSAESGGTNDSGSIFRVNTNGAFRSLHDFAQVNFNASNVETNFDGDQPYGTLLAGGDGWLYGTTYGGGTNGYGTIFRLNTNNGAFSLLHTFGAVDVNYANADGANPLAGLTLYGSGVFWGAATLGGTNGNGTIFQITTGGVFTVVHTFNMVSDGTLPSAALFQGRDGNFYGSTEVAAFMMVKAHCLLSRLTEC